MCGRSSSGHSPRRLSRGCFYRLTREVKELGRPATASHLGDWNRETARISTDIEGVEIQVYSAAGRDAQFTAWLRGRELSPADTSCADTAGLPDFAVHAEYYHRAFRRRHFVGPDNETAARVCRMNVNCGIVRIIRNRRRGQSGRDGDRRREFAGAQARAKTGANSCAVLSKGKACG